MSVLINMEMPTSCAECRLMADGWCYSVGLEQREKISTVKRPTWCPLVPVPPHGRLGDLDKLAERIEGIWDCNDLYFQPHDHICDPEDCKGCKWRETWDCFRRMVKHTPTIIPAEEGE